MSEQAILESLRAMVADDFDVLGEIGRDAHGTLVYLARDRAALTLVALRLEPQVGEEYALDIVRVLDASIPDAAGSCPRCSASLRPWARFCTQCRYDLSGIGPSDSGTNVSREDLRAAVEAAAADEFEVLGDMPRAEGGGLVYFARDRSDGKVVALRLQREGADEYALGVTQVLKPLPRPVVRPMDAPVTSPVTIVPRGGTGPIPVAAPSRRPARNAPASFWADRRNVNAALIVGGGAIVLLLLWLVLR
jgi:hypothetical protein